MAVVEARQDERAADRAAELVPVERRLQIDQQADVRPRDFAKEGSGVERVIAQY